MNKREERLYRKIKKADTVSTILFILQQTDYHKIICFKNLNYLYLTLSLLSFQ